METGVVLEQEEEEPETLLPTWERVAGLGLDPPGCFQCRLAAAELMHAVCRARDYVTKHVPSRKQVCYFLVA